MRYYLGHWQWTNANGMACYAPPAGVVGCLDLGRLPEMSVGGADRGRLFCWTANDATLPSEYELLGVGDCREMNTDGAMLDAFQSLVGYRPQGDKLVDAVWDCMEGGADIDGSDGPLPLVPTVGGNLELHFAGHSIVKRRRFQWGSDAATPKLKQLLRKEFRGLMQDAKGGKLKDAKHHRRVLDYWCDKYRVSDWREFVPANLQKDVPGRVKHETTITDDFNRSDASSLGAASGGWSWSYIDGSADIGIASNRATWINNTRNARTLRADSDLSSSDSYAQCAIVLTPSDGSAIVLGPLCRKDSSGTLSFYLSITTMPEDYRALFKAVSGSYTQLSSNNTTDEYADGQVIKVDASGSSIALYVDGVSRITSTDTSVATGTRGGLFWNNLANPNSPLGVLTADDFQAADLAAGPTGSPWNYYAQQGG